MSDARPPRAMNATDATCAGTANVFAGGRLCFGCLASQTSVACERCGGAADAPGSPRVERAAWSIPGETIAAAVRLAAEVAHSRGYVLGRVAWSFPSGEELRRTNLLWPVASESSHDPAGRCADSPLWRIRVGAHFRGTVEMVVCPKEGAAR